MPNQGEKAPSFSLPDTERKQRSLQELLSPKGATILAFYPGAFTGVCTKEMCTFRDSLTQLGNINAKVVGISVNDPFSNKAFAENSSTLRANQAFLDFPHPLFLSTSEVSGPATRFLRFHHVGDRRRFEVLLWIILKFSLTSQRLSSHHSDPFSVESRRVHQSAEILVPYPHSLQCKILHHTC